MCVSPIKIPNKNFGTPKRVADKFPWKEFQSPYIEVPCGHCDECIRAKQDAIVQRVQMESLKNHIFMCTLTYQEAFIPFIMVNGKKTKYADVHDVQCMIKMLKKYNVFGIPFRYMGVSEYGSKYGRPHFHLIFLFDKKYFPNEKDQYVTACEAFASKSQHYFDCLCFWRRNIGSRRRPIWQPLTKYRERWIDGVLNKNYDFHYINPFLTKNGVSDCGAYVVKYMFKPSDQVTKKQTALRLNLSPEDYEEVWNIIKPRCFKSIGFGLNADVQLKKGKFIIDEDIKKKILRDIAVSRQNLDFPAIFHIDSGKPKMLAEYYRSFAYYDFFDEGEDLPAAADELTPPSKRKYPLFSYDDRYYFYLKSKLYNKQNPIKNQTQLENSSESFKRHQDRADKLGRDRNFNVVSV